MNENCLEGVSCPKCGQDKRFWIEGEAMFDVTDDGTTEFQDVEWDDDSLCRCRECGHQGILAAFKSEGVAAITRNGAETVSVTLDDLVELRCSYSRAVKNGMDTFKFKGHDVLVAYAKYLIEYLESLNKGGEHV